MVENTSDPAPAPASQSAPTEWGSALVWAVIVAVGLWLYFSPDKEEIFYPDVVLRNDLTYASARQWDTKGLQWLTAGASGIAFAREPAPNVLEGQNVVVLVHGFGSPQSQLIAYHDGLIACLREDLKLPGAIVINDWPSVEVVLDKALGRKESRSGALAIVAMHSRPDLIAEQEGAWTQARYRIDQEYARTTGADGLVALLGVLKSKGASSVSIVAHSMGSYVVTEAIKRKPETFVNVGRLVLLAADVPSSVFDDPAVRAASAGIGQVHIFYSRGDRVLSLYSVAANWKRRLGADGPDNASSLPRNVIAHDLTEKFGSSEAVHSRYLTREGAAQLGLADILAGVPPKQR